MTFREFLLNEAASGNPEKVVQELLNKIMAKVKADKTKLGKLKLSDFVMSKPTIDEIIPKGNKSEAYVSLVSIHDLEQYEYDKDYDDEDEELATKKLASIVKSIPGFEVTSATLNKVKGTYKGVDVNVSLLD